MKVLLAHGAGGKETSNLLETLLFSKVEEVLKRTKEGVGLDRPDDGAAIKLPDGSYMVLSIDSYTVKPLFFPGGDIGKLAACGSINDVWMMGAKPVAMMDAMVIEEGLEIDTLKRIMHSFLKVLREEDIPLIGGDLKVMPKGEIDGIVITTLATGIAKRPIVDDEVKPGDRVIISGTIGDHGATILATQKGLNLEKSGLSSDVMSLTRLMEPLIRKYGDHIHAARDPTRGGIAMALNDWSKASESVVVIYEENLPIRPEVKAYAEMLGIDPLQLASEGRALLAVDGEVAEEVLCYLKELGFEDSSMIGEVKRGRLKGFVLLKTVVGGFRIVEPPTGSIVPRIC